MLTTGACRSELKCRRPLEERERPEIWNNVAKLWTQQQWLEKMVTAQANQEMCKVRTTLMVGLALPHTESVDRQAEMRLMGKMK